jgi:hypothetical protein
MSDYPEHDKLIANKARAEAAGEFYDWLTSRGIQLVRWLPRQPGSSCEDAVSVGPISDLIGGWLEIDPMELEREKRLMLVRIRNGEKI